MPTFILGKTLVFWSGVAAVTFFALDVLTCWWVNSLGIPFLKSIKPPLPARYHHLFKPASILFVLLHVTLALLANVLGILL